MADKKISDFTAASSIATNDLFEIESAGGNSRKVTGQQIIDLMALSGMPVLIQEVVTSGSQSNVTFAAIPGTYRNLELKITGRGDTGAVNTKVLLQFNSDTGANYDTDIWILAGGGAAAVTGSGAAQTSIACVYLAASSAPAGAVGACAVEILDYKGTTFHKSAISNGFNKQGAAATDLNVFPAGGLWRSTAAITDIKVFLSAGNFVDGSVVSLHGRM
jgi:hypothetical protein